MGDYAIRRLSVHENLVARTMQHALQETAQITLHTECDVTDLWRRVHRTPNHVAFSTCVVHAALEVLAEEPSLNAHVAGGEVCLYRHVRLGVMVPFVDSVGLGCISDAAALSLAELDEALHGLRARAAEGRLAIEEMRGATFSVVDLSGYPVDAFVPILLPTAIAMLGIGRVRDACLPDEDGACRAARLLSLNLTFDHRATDALKGGAFLERLTSRLVAQREKIAR